MQKCVTAGSRCPRCASLSVRSGPAQPNPAFAAVPVRSVLIRVMMVVIYRSFSETKRVHSQLAPGDFVLLTQAAL